MKRKLGAILAVIMLLSLLPAGAAGTGERGISSRTVIDTDGSDGYSGDYVVIYNPSTMADNAKTTGDMLGRINTEVEPYTWKGISGERLRCPMTDVDAELAKDAMEKGAYLPKAETRDPLNFEVGDTREFVISWYSPTGTTRVLFKVLAKGEHCYVWTPVSDDPNVWPLDSLRLRSDGCGRVRLQIRSYARELRRA